MSRKNYIMTNESADRTGIVAALTACLARHEGSLRSFRNSERRHQSVSIPA